MTEAQLIIGAGAFAVLLAVIGTVSAEYEAHQARKRRAK